MAGSSASAPRNLAGSLRVGMVVRTFVPAAGLGLWLAAAALAAQASPPTSAALPPHASAAFGRAASRYTDGGAHSSHFVQIYTPAGFTTAKRESGRIWIQAPQRLHFEYQAPEKKTFTYDAGEGRLFTPEDKQLTIQKLSPEDRARLPIVFLSDPEDLAREYSVSAEAADGGATRILLKPKAPRADLAWLRLTILRDGAVSDLSYEDASGNRTEFRFDAWSKEKPRSAGDYRVTGPPGTRILQN